MNISDKLKAIADAQNTTTFISHCPDGAAIIYVSAEEKDVLGQLMSAGLQIESKRVDTVGKTR